MGTLLCHSYTSTHKLLVDGKLFIQLVKLTGIFISKAVLALLIIPRCVLRVFDVKNGQFRCKLLVGRGAPLSSQKQQPYSPLYCFMFSTAALAGRSTEHINSLALTVHSPSGVFTENPKDYIIQCHVIFVII